jgi:hypothetical protein
LFVLIKARRDELQKRPEVFIKVLFILAVVESDRNLGVATTMQVEDAMVKV